MTSGMSRCEKTESLDNDVRTDVRTKSAVPNSTKTGVVCEGGDLGGGHEGDCLTTIH